MKKTAVLLFTLFIYVANVAGQDIKEAEGETKTVFKKENLFAGGTVALGFGSGQTSFGLGPYFGYSFNKYIDAAISLNYNYVSIRDKQSSAKLRQSIIGPGIFTRIYPVKFLFVHVQYEQNFIKQKSIPAANGYYFSADDPKSAASFLIGPGYASGREESKSFYYISILFDVAKNINSPYVDEQGRINPIIRAGYNIALFQGKADGGGGGSARRRSKY